MVIIYPEKGIHGDVANLIEATLHLFHGAVTSQGFSLPLQLETCRLQLKKPAIRLFRIAGARLNCRGVRTAVKRPLL
ncbi:MAG: hypothetical protein QNK37_22185, partial [Acidobacteriota bacterium]|nr:hypothetical protein [Acidobacteriota bacterium]